VRALPKERLPLLRRGFLQLVHVVHDAQQRAVARLVHDVVELVALVRIVDALEPGPVLRLVDHG
jgi:hypothetical protein